jgi:hypothetical protein
MLRSLIAAAIALVAFVAAAEAHNRQRPRPPVTSCNSADLMRQCFLDGNFLRGVRSIDIEMKRLRVRPGRRDPTASVTTTLAGKVDELKSVCGARVVSGIRHTMIAGTRRLSLHATGNAVDMAGDSACIYRNLIGWPGGYSTDYTRMRHVHISLDVAGGREMGLRFRHGQTRRHWRRSFGRSR